MNFEYFYIYITLLLESQITPCGKIKMAVLIIHVDIVERLVFGL